MKGNWTWGLWWEGLQQDMDYVYEKDDDFHVISISSREENITSEVKLPKALSLECEHQTKYKLTISSQM